MGKVSQQMLNLSFAVWLHPSVRLALLSFLLLMQTTNLLLQAGQEALTANPGSVATLSPLRWASHMTNLTQADA